jgi:hypothetical protein
MRFAWLPFVVVLACAGCAAPDGLGEIRAPIVNGTRETGYPQVVVVARLGITGEAGLCSGTVIGRFAVMTAKHCVFNDNGDGTHTLVPARDFLVVTGDDISAPVSTHEVYDIRTSPGSDVDRDIMGGNDIAIMLLYADIEIPPHGYATAGPDIGDAITIVGFGRTRGGAPMPMDSGVKYRGSTSVSDTGTRLFETRGASWTCQGDSGGPAYDPDGNVAGITSFGPGGCTSSNSYFTRVARHTTLIADALTFVPPCEPATEVCDGRDNNCDGTVDEGCTALGEACTRADQCEGSRCESIGGSMVCTRDCDPTTAIPRCPIGFHCEETGCGMGRCAPGEGGGVPDGEACSTAAECASFRCVDVAGSMRCARACTPEGDACSTVDLLCELGAGGCGDCIPVELSTGPRPFGAPCDADAQCTSTDCVDGFCTRACSATMICPGGWHCRGALCIRGEVGGPGDDCVTSEDCGGSAPECVTTSDGDQLCAGPCDATGMCEPGSGLECSESDAGDRCLPPGLALGEMCSSSDECRSAFCASICTRFCTPAEPCPSGFDCVPAGSAFACIRQRDTDPPSRDSGGCATTSRRASSPLFLILGLLSLALGARRHGRRR